jgi:hypothetical protein
VAWCAPGVFGVTPEIARAAKTVHARVPLKGDPLRARAQRKIPLALTSATLTFGACGDDGKKETGTDGAVTAALERVATAICKTAQRCKPAVLEQEFENLRGCVEYYKEYYSQYYADLDDAPSVDDPVGCRRAVTAALDCVARSYTNLSCEAFDGDDYTEGDEGKDIDPCDEEFDELDLACELEDEVDVDEG